MVLNKVRNAHPQLQLLTRGMIALALSLPTVLQRTIYSNLLMATGHRQHQ